MIRYSYTHNQRRLLILVGGVVILLVVFPVIFRILFAADYEVSYSAGFGVSTCSDFYISDASQLVSCTSRYNLIIGNTGTQMQERIAVKLQSIPAGSRLNWNVLDIVATNNSAARPEITSQRDANELQILIQNLAPNRLVEFSAVSSGNEAAKVMQQSSIEIAATGTMIQANPRLTLILRFIRNMAGIFGY